MGARGCVQVDPGGGGEKNQWCWCSMLGLIFGRHMIGIHVELGEKWKPAICRFPILVALNILECKVGATLQRYDDGAEKVPFRTSDIEFLYGLELAISREAVGVERRVFFGNGIE